MSSVRGQVCYSRRDKATWMKAAYRLTSVSSSLRRDARDRLRPVLDLAETCPLYPWDA